jgi:hypothetical protein
MPCNYNAKDKIFKFPQKYSCDWEFETSKPESKFSVMLDLPSWYEEETQSVLLLTIVTDIELKCQVMVNDSESIYKACFKKTPPAAASASKISSVIHESKLHDRVEAESNSEPKDISKSQLHNPVELMNVSTESAVIEVTINESTSLKSDIDIVSDINCGILQKQQNDTITQQIIPNNPSLDSESKGHESSDDEDESNYIANMLNSLLKKKSSNNRSSISSPLSSKINSKSGLEENYIS